MPFIEGYTNKNRSCHFIREILNLRNFLRSRASRMYIYRPRENFENCFVWNMQSLIFLLSFAKINPPRILTFILGVCDFSTRETFYLTKSNSKENRDTFASVIEISCLFFHHSRSQHIPAYDTCWYTNIVINWKWINYWPLWDCVLNFPFCSL